MNLNPFHWGTVVKTHTIGDITIIEYIVSGEFSDSGETQFHHDLSSCSFDTLDQALIHAICWKHEPGVYDTANYVWRIIKGADK